MPSGNPGQNNFLRSRNFSNQVLDLESGNFRHRNEMTSQCCLSVANQIHDIALFKIPNLYTKKVGQMDENCDQNIFLFLFFLVCFKVSPYTTAGFDITTHSFGDDTSRPRRQGFIRKCFQQLPAYVHTCTALIFSRHWCENFFKNHTCYITC
jgi:hypothetical protein